MTETFAYIATMILVLLTVFQIALIAGAPIGKFAWGGAHTVLPTKLRIGSTVSIFLYFIFSIIILNKAGLIDLIDNDSFINVGIWALAGYFLLGVLMNGISRSKLERAVMTPVALILAILCFLVAINQ